MPSTEEARPASIGAADDRDRTHRPGRVVRSARRPFEPSNASAAARRCDAPTRNEGVRGGIRTHGPRIQPHFGFRRPRASHAVRGPDCPFTLAASPRPSGATHPVSTPSAPEPKRGLARDRHGASAPKRSPTLSGSTAPFPCAAPNSFRNPVLYPAELRGQRLDHSGGASSRKPMLQNAVSRRVAARNVASSAGNRASAPRAAPSASSAASASRAAA